MNSEVNLRDTIFYSTLISEEEEFSDIEIFLYSKILFPFLHFQSLLNLRLLNLKLSKLILSFIAKNHLFRVDINNYDYLNMYGFKNIIIIEEKKKNIMGIRKILPNSSVENIWVKMKISLFFRFPKSLKVKTLESEGKIMIFRKETNTMNKEIFVCKEVYFFKKYLQGSSNPIPDQVTHITTRGWKFRLSTNSKLEYLRTRIINHRDFLPKSLRELVIFKIRKQEEIDAIPVEVKILVISKVKCRLDFSRLINLEELYMKDYYHVLPPNLKIVLSSAKFNNPEKFIDEYIKEGKDYSHLMQKHVFKKYQRKKYNLRNLPKTRLF